MFSHGKGTKIGTKVYCEKIGTGDLIYKAEIETPAWRTNV